MNGHLAAKTARLRANFCHTQVGAINYNLRYNYVFFYGHKINMLVIRLSRGGGKKRPYSHIVVAEKSRPRDGRFIERIGFCNPLATGKAEAYRLDGERFDYWWAKALNQATLFCVWRGMLAVSSQQPSPANNKYPPLVVMARLGAPHGVRGWLRVLPHSLNLIL